MKITPDATKSREKEKKISAACWEKKSLKGEGK
jgi:hypothetical protein